MTKSLNECRYGVLVHGVDSGNSTPESLIILSQIIDISRTSYEMLHLYAIRLGTDPNYLDLNQQTYHLGSDTVYFSGDDNKAVVKAPEIVAEGAIKLLNPNYPNGEIQSVISVNNDSIELLAKKIFVNGLELSANVSQLIVVDNTLAVSSVAVIQYLENYALKTDLPAVESEITTEETKKENAINSKAVIAYAASVLTPYSTTSETMEYISDQNFATVSQIPEPTVIPEKLLTLNDCLETEGELRIRTDEEDIILQTNKNGGRIIFRTTGNRYTMREDGLFINDDGGSGDHKVLVEPDLEDAMAEIRAEIPIVDSTVSSDGENAVNSKAVVNYISSQTFATVSQIPEPTVIPEKLLALEEHLTVKGVAGTYTSFSLSVRDVSLNLSQNGVFYNDSEIAKKSDIS
jgi:hypothetical protein